MIKNIQSLMDKSKNFAKEKGLSVQEVLQNYMFERFLERLSKSEYNENFIIKGRFLLSSIMGINMRTTMDIDVNITGMDFERSTIEEMINKIITVKIDDDVTFEIDKNIPIKEDNEYNGYRFKLIAKLSNLRIPFGIDISTGDLITPRAIEYNYKTILENDNIDLYTYNYETIIAEKLETILKRNTANSRMKDYYDLYYFVTYKWSDIDITILKSAIHTTFTHRNSEEYLKRFNTIIKNILEDETLIVRWDKYRKEHEYAKEIEFNDTIKAIIKIYDLL